MAASSDNEGTGNIWVLDTETKGTGAHVVPLERVLRKGSDRVPGFTLPERQRPEEPAPEPRKPHRFRILDVMTREVLADGVDVRHALEVLADVRSIVDVTIFASDAPGEQWRRLTFPEAKALWDLRAELAVHAAAEKDPPIDC